jgi:hypothetical protein
MCVYERDRLVGHTVTLLTLVRLLDMFDEMSKATKEKERVMYKGYATIRTNFGNLNVELHGDRVSMRNSTPPKVISTLKDSRTKSGSQNSIQLA